jgi:large subunit ribosomal protein L5
MTDSPSTARLKTRYLEEIRPALVERFGYSSLMQAPKLEKITLNMGVGLAKQDSKMLKAATEQLATIAGQQPSVRRARKSIAAFKLREGMPVGVAVTLRGQRGYEFLDRLVSIAIPRIRDFRGLNPRSFDGRGNYSMGVKEQIIFPEIDYDAIDLVRGLDITITTSAASDAEAFALLYAFGMPFAAQGRPKGFNEAAGVQPEPAPEPEPEPAAQAEPEAGAEAAPAEAEPEAEAAPAEVDASPEPEPEPEPAEEPPTEAAAVTEAEPEPEAAEEPEPEAAKKPEPEAAKKPGPEAAKKPGPEAAKKPGPEAAKKPEPEAAKKPEPEEPVAEQGTAAEDADQATAEKESTD